MGQGLHVPGVNTMCHAMRITDIDVVSLLLNSL